MAEIFKPPVAIVIPAYNAGNSLFELLKQIIKKYPPENIVVVDDGSVDNTSDIAQNAKVALIRNDCNSGKGTSLYSGLCWAYRNNFSWAITMDADGQHKTEDINCFLEHIPGTGTAIVVGQRRIKGTFMPFHRRFSNYVTTLFISILAHQHVYDTQSGFRMYRTKLFSGNVITKKGRFEWESRILVEVSRLGYTIDSVPVSTVYNKQGSHMHLYYDTLRFIKMYFGLIINK